MPLRVICRAQYLSEPVENMRQEDYNATHLVKAVKGRDLNPKAYAWVKIDGQNTKITEGTKDKAIEWFAKWAARHVDAADGESKILVPVPSSSTIATPSPDFRTAVIASAIARRCRQTVRVAPLLRWRQPMTPARQGGSRDARVLYPNLIIVGDRLRGTPILIDDVYTLGGHLIACAWKLREVSGRAPDLAICCGRTLHHQLENPLAVEDEFLEL